ncbi:MAG: hypothetical protein ACI9CO_000865 [Candidatus Azotimanducaceae bacterium]|jgi:hypothetical protein
MEILLQKLISKVDNAKEDSDFTYFFNLLVYGEALAKIIVLSVTSCLNQDKDRHQYRVLHNLVRANGIGEWGKELDELLSGTASQFFDSNFRMYQSEMNKNCNEEEWQYYAVSEIAKALTELGIEVQLPQGKRALKTWFKLFAEIRNKTRGHGATSSTKAANAAQFLRNSIETIEQNLSLLRIPCAYVKRNLSGKYRISPINDVASSFDEIKKSNELAIEDGLYFFLGRYIKLNLIQSDPDLQDFFISNGGFTNKKYELISYYTDDKISGDSSAYMLPPGQLPPSESEGLGELRDAGNCFTNMPSLNYEYIARTELEDELFSLLMDDRRDLVTLLGRGGIGKTSLALKVIPRLFYEKKYDAIIWFSSRDIDLQDSGVKLVSADVITAKDISRYYCRLVLSDQHAKSKNLDPMDYFQNQLTSSDIGPSLFVFDNFETTENPTELYKWIDTYIRSPNKVLITTRLRDFRGDYPLNVSGMTEAESKKLIQLTSKKLRIENQLDMNIYDEIYSVSSGHPYIIKVLLGELAESSGNKAVKRILIGNDDILISLFERTYAALSPSSQRIFLTLAAWNSAISRVVLEAVLMGTIEVSQGVEKAIDLLVQYSMAEEVKSSIDGEIFIGLPYVATAFGKKKLAVSSLEALVVNDSRMLQKFGPSKLDDKNLSLTSHVRRFVSTFDNDNDNDNDNDELVSCIKVIERICFVNNISRTDYAQWLMEEGSAKSLEKAAGVLTLYLENESSDNKKSFGWRLLADVHRIIENHYEEVHALLQLAKFSDIEFSELSNVANKVNQKFGQRLLIIENHSVKTQLISELYEVMLDRKDEAGSTDLSRMAWLGLNLNKHEDALNLIESGLHLDPNNQYCLKLESKFRKDIL